MGAVEAAGLSPAPGAGQGQPGSLCTPREARITQRDGCSLGGGVQLSVTVAYSLGSSLPGTKQPLKKKKKKKRAFPPLLEDEGIFALIPKQTHLMPLNTPWHY